MGGSGEEEEDLEVVLRFLLFFNFGRVKNTILKGGGGEGREACQYVQRSTR